MRRILVAIALCLLLGLLTSIALAWAGAFVGPIDSPKEELWFSHNNWTGEIDVIECQTDVRLRKPHVFDDGSVQPRFSGLNRDEDEPPSWFPIELATREYRFSAIDGTAYGMPMRCLYTYSTTARQGLIQKWDARHYGAVRGANLMASVHGSTHLVSALPVRPIWVGLLGNAMVFALPWAGLLLLGYGCRRRRRQRRLSTGRCPRCQYDIRESSERCPECGALIHARSAVVTKLGIVTLSIAAIIGVGSLLAVVVCTVAMDPEPKELRAAYVGDVDAVRAAIEAGVDPSEDIAVRLTDDAGAQKQHLNMLVAAIGGGQRDVVDLLLRSDVELNHPGYENLTAFELACTYGAYEIADQLLEAGARPCFDLGCRRAVYLAAQLSQPYLVDLLDLKGIDFSIRPDVLDQAVSAWGWNSRYHPDKQQYWPTLKRLLELDCPVSYSAISTAVYFCDLELLQLLIEHGGDVTSTPTRSWYQKDSTLLIDAVESSCSEELINALIDLGVNVNAATEGGRTALMVAAEHRNAKIVELLLERGANPNHVVNDRFSALYWAAVLNRTESVRVLLEHGADPTQLDEQTVRYSTREIRELLESAQKTPTSSPDADTS